MNINSILKLLHNVYVVLQISGSNTTSTSPINTKSTITKKNKSVYLVNLHHS